MRPWPALVAVACSNMPPCHQVPQAGEAVREVQADGGFPTGAGGALADGDWAATRFEWYQPRVLRLRQTTLRLAAGVAEIVDHTSDSAGLSSTDTETRLTAQLTLGSAGAIALEQTCPRALPLPFDRYTATPDQLVLISTSDQQVITFKKK